jgi:biopolymer transport protein ExbB
MQTQIQSKPSTFLARMALGLLALLTLSASAKAWWSEEWTIRKKITIDPKAAGISEPLSNASVLVRLHDGDFQFANAKEDGTDLRFVAADDKTVLPYHIEKFDALMSEAFVWVKMPEIKAGEPVSFWLYYGNGGPKAIKADDPKGTFDADTVLVYHFSEKGAPASDSSASAINAQNPGQLSEGAMIGNGVRFDGKNGIQIPAADPLAWNANGTMTLSLWIKPTATAANQLLFSRREDNRSFVVGVDKGVPFVEVANSGAPQRSGAGAPIQANSWHHLALVAASGKISVYLDGANYASVDQGLPALKGALQIGLEQDADNQAGFTGEIDELVISKTARSASWIKWGASTQGAEAAKVLTVGADEQPTGILSWLLTGTFGVIVKSLTVDGWIVIGILAVMSLLSWFVMFNKVNYLNGIAKGNALFMDQWRRLASDLTALDEDDGTHLQSMGGKVDKKMHGALRKSSVYRIYHIGVEEIRHRLAADRNANGRKALSGRSIQAIRASLDGGLVRETQKINSLVVLLTICISGGPFLGLLGTVIGVMITFAAVAAAGEVNVNAIAPGIAAALLATVAGLAVAIPSLFGYNYILSRVKDAKDDMHIFIDEFVTKMAEFYNEKSSHANAYSESVH